MANNVTLEVNRTDCSATRLAEAPLDDLGEGQVRLRIDRFALTANNITYAVIGDLLGYWDFFPTGDPAWGRVPAMGWADVVESNHPGVPVGGRYYGWYPMARFVDLTVKAVAGGIRDDGPHRLEHASVYRNYVETTHDPMYPTTPSADDGGDGEDRHALLRGLFLTAFLADEFFEDQKYFGATQVVVLSASSKTAIGFAQRASERGAAGVVGITSAANVDFVRSLGWYSDVLTYDDIGNLPDHDAVSVDMAGNMTALAAVHEALGDHLHHSMIIGKSHHDVPPAEVTAGPNPEFFFAPTEGARLLEQWGAEEFQSRSNDALAAFVAESARWLTVQRSTGPAAAEATYHDVYDGTVPPNVGRVVSLHD